MAWAFLLAVSSVAAKNIPRESVRCLDGKRYRIMPANDALVATETGECCEGFQLQDANCIEANSPFSLDPVLLSRFVTAIGLLLLLCAIVAIVSMLIAYTMFYRGKAKADYSERVTLAEDLDSQSVTSSKG